MLPEVTSPEVTWLDVTWTEVKSVTWPEVTSFPPRIFLTIVVIQNVPLFVFRFWASDYSFGIFWTLCCLSFNFPPLIPLISSSFSCKGIFCTTTIVRKKCRKMMSLMIWKIWKKVSWNEKWYGKYGRKTSRIAIRYGQYGRKASWIVKRYEQYGRNIS